MGFFGALDHVQGKTLYHLMSAACGSAFMLYGWDAGVLGGIQSTPQFLETIGNPQNPQVCGKMLKSISTSFESRGLVYG